MSGRRNAHPWWINYGFKVLTDWAVSGAVYYCMINALHNNGLGYLSTVSLADTNTLEIYLGQKRLELRNAFKVLASLLYHKLSIIGSRRACLN
jgi:hypothetical protein